MMPPHHDVFHLFYFGLFISRKLFCFVVHLATWPQFNIQILEMQASGLEGPLPSSLSALNNMTYLRISDLSGESSAFPNLSNMTSMVKLMLRSCNITGEIPEYISTMRNLTDLDLSFNRLEGSIPDLENIIQLSTIYLTRNLLTGLPAWIKNRGSSFNIDLSYNNLSQNSVPDTCQIPSICSEVFPAGTIRYLANASFHVQKIGTRYI
nr:probable leucine-rich repeat receptor-like serine/threonine-protein kinase At3g14840 isoform X2 [Malus domestica]